MVARNVVVGEASDGEASLPDEPGAYVRLSVSDDGSGMPSEVRNQAFEPFFTTKSDGLGSGLGLSMVYGFVKQSGGHVAIDSTVGEGTTVTIYLPRSDLPPVEELAAIATQTGGSETVLLVEDDQQVRTTVAELLKDLGYTVIEACDAEEALALLDAGHRVDLLFTDVVMPGPVKSRDLAREAKARHPGMAVLYTSGYPREDISHEGRLEAGIDLLGKPYALDELARAIRRVLGARPKRRRSLTLSTAPHHAMVGARGERACANRAATKHVTMDAPHQREVLMKGMEQKKNDKKKPLKTPKEKKAEKAARKAGKN